MDTPPSKVSVDPNSYRALTRELEANRSAYKDLEAFALELKDENKQLRLEHDTLREKLRVLSAYTKQQTASQRRSLSVGAIYALTASIALVAWSAAVLACMHIAYSKGYTDLFNIYVKGFWWSFISCMVMGASVGIIFHKYRK